MTLLRETTDYYTQRNTFRVTGHRETKGRKEKETRREREGEKERQEERGRGEEKEKKRHAFTARIRVMARLSREHVRT